MAGGAKDLWLAFGIRLLMASPLFLLGAVIVRRAGGNVVGMLLGFFFILIGCVMVARPLARILAEPFGNIFYTVDHFDEPQPIYSIPEARVQEKNFEAAMALYQKITEQYKNQPKAFIGMMNVAGVYLKDARRTEQIFHQGLIQLTRKQDKDNLAIAYKAIRSRLEDKPEWNRERVISRKPDPESEGPDEAGRI